MRTIKFRGKSIEPYKKNGEMVFGYLIDSSYGPTIISSAYHVDGAEWNLIDDYNVDPESIAQFTGYKDSEGTEIYEGDQLYVSAGYSSVVVFKDGAFYSVYSHPEDPEEILLADVLGPETVVISGDENWEED